MYLVSNFSLRKNSRRKKQNPAQNLLVRNKKVLKVQGRKLKTNFQLVVSVSYMAPVRNNWKEKASEDPVQISYQLIIGKSISNGASKKQK